MSELLAPPAGFRIGHWTDEVGRTGCTVVIAPEGTRGGVDVRGGGPGTRETDVVSPLAGTDRVSAVMFAGGSAYGLAAADGAMRWLEEHGIGYPTPAALVPIVPAAIAYDLAEGDAGARPTAESGYAACEAAREGVPERGGWAPGRARRRGRCWGEARRRQSGRWICGGARRLWRDGGGACGGESVRRRAWMRTARCLPAPRAEGAPRTVDFIAALERAPTDEELEARNTTLVCVMTDAALDKAGCARVARAASAGIARAVEPVFTDVDGDVVFCLASGARRGGGEVRGDPARGACGTGDGGGDPGRGDERV